MLKVFLKDKLPTITDWDVPNVRKFNGEVVEGRPTKVTESLSLIMQENYINQSLGQKKLKLSKKKQRHGRQK